MPVAVAPWPPGRLPTRIIDKVCPQRPCAGAGSARRTREGPRGSPLARAVYSITTCEAFFMHFKAAIAESLHPQPAAERFR